MGGKNVSKHLLTIIKIHLILAKVGAFSALDSTNSGGVTHNQENSVGVSGCSGKMIVEKEFQRGDIEKVDTDGFSQHWTIKANKKRDKARTNNIKIEGTCCWVILDRHGETEEFALGEEKEPRIAYIYTIKTKKCD